MRTERVAFNVPVDILASLKIGTRGVGIGYEAFFGRPVLQKQAVVSG